MLAVTHASGRDNIPMALAMEILAEIELDQVRSVVANDGARSSFTVSSADSVLTLDRNLTVTGRWPAGDWAPDSTPPCPIGNLAVHPHPLLTTANCASPKAGAASSTCVTPGCRSMVEDSDVRWRRAVTRLSRGTSV